MKVTFEFFSMWDSYLCLVKYFWGQLSHLKTPAWYNYEPWLLIVYIIRLTCIICLNSFLVIFPSGCFCRKCSYRSSTSCLQCATRSDHCLILPFERSWFFQGFFHKTTFSSWQLTKQNRVSEQTWIVLCGSKWRSSPLPLGRWMVHRRKRYPSYPFSWTSIKISSIVEAFPIQFHKW